MLRTFAVALLAATVFTAPVLAQGGAAATPPVKTETNATAKPIKTSKHYAHRHVKHVKHAAHVKRVKHVKTAHAVHGAKAHKQVRHVSRTTIGQNGVTPAPKAKSNVN